MMWPIALVLIVLAIEGVILAAWWAYIIYEMISWEVDYWRRWYRTWKWEREGCP